LLAAIAAGVKKGLQIKYKLSQSLSSMYNGTLPFPVPGHPDKTSKITCKKNN